MDESTIYTLFTCDAWKSCDSMRMYWVGTNYYKAIEAIKKGIKDKYFEFDSSGEDDVDSQIESLDGCIKEMPLAFPYRKIMSELNSRICYCHIEMTSNNSYC